MDIKTGDEVRVKPPASRQRKQPEDGYAGRIVKVARKYATAEYEYVYEDSRGVQTYPRSIEFEIATGRERDNSTNYPTYVYTAEAMALKVRTDAAKNALKSAGLEFRLGRERDFSLECIEALAAVLRDQGMVS